MQHLQAGALDLALEFLTLSYEKCRLDPLLLQEMGVLYYHLQEYVFLVDIKCELIVLKRQSTI